MYTSQMLIAGDSPKQKAAPTGAALQKLAEMQGFEPREDLRPRLISSQVH